MIYVIDPKVLDRVGISSLQLLFLSEVVIDDKGNVAKNRKDSDISEEAMALVKKLNG